MALLNTIGKLGYNTLEGIGEFTIGAAKPVSQGVASLGRTGLNMAAGAVKITSDNLLKEAPDKLLNYEFNTLGKAAFLGGMAYSGISGAIDYENQLYQGTPTGVVTPTPSVTQTSMAMDAQNYGAGGDLVFALNRNRRG